MPGPLMPRLRLAAVAAALALAPALSGALAQEAVPRLSFSVERFEVEGDNPLSAVRTEEILAPYAGEHEGLAGIEAAAQALEAGLAKAGYGFYRVIVPPQRATGGVFRLKVLAFRLKNVEVAGNEHFDDANIKASLPSLRVGEVPDSRAYARDVSLANEHSAKRVAVFMRESDEPGFIDARVETRDARPWQVFASLSNTGSEATGDDRLSLGAQYGNLFNRDHALTVSYTTSPGNYGDVKQYGLHYRAPIYPWHSVLNVFYTESDVEQGTVAQFFDVSGAGRFKGFDFVHTLAPRGKYSHKVAVGIQDKLFEDDSVFQQQGLPQIPIGSDVRSRPLALRYEGRWQRAELVTGFSAEYARNLESGDLNDDADYAAVSNGFAKASWDLVRLRADADYAVGGDWHLLGRFSLQYAGESLISGEQFGVGGVASVRGLEERELAGDNGLFLSIAGRSPEIQPGLHGILFADHGRIRRERTVAGIEPGDSASSIGAGLRWQIGPHVNLSLDLARVLNGATDTGSGDEKLHFNLFARY